MSAHKYWRLDIASNNGLSNWHSIHELKLMNVSGGPQLAVGGIATADSTYSTLYEADNAFDGLLATRWISADGFGNAPTWIQYEFASATNITHFSIYTEETTYLTAVPKDFCMQWSDNGIDFNNVTCFDNETGWVTGEEREYELGFRFSTPSIQFSLEFQNAIPIVEHLWPVPVEIDLALEVTETKLVLPQTPFLATNIDFTLEIAEPGFTPQTRFPADVVDFALEIADPGFTFSGYILKPYPIDVALHVPKTWITQIVSNYSKLATDYLWYEGNWPLFEHVPGTLPTDYLPIFWQPVEWKELLFKMSVPLLGDIIRNDSPDRVPVINSGVLVESPLLYFFGCDVIPKTIHVDTVLTQDYFVPIQISNNNLGKWIEIRSLTIVNDPFNTMEILGHNWPKMLAPYSVETYTLKISGTAGYPTFDAILIVDVGTCYTEIPITGVRDVGCPICPECPPPCPPEETEDMPSCMIEQELCAISRGDTVPFSFVFVTPSGAAMDISNMQLEFTLKIDVKQEIPDLIKTITFPASADSIAGIGTMKITPTETLSLLAGACYCFKFKLKNGVDDVYTIGLGTVRVNPDPPTPIT